VLPLRRTLVRLVILFSKHTLAIMNKILRQISSEIIWPIVCACLSLLIILILWRWDFEHHLIAIDILGSSVVFPDFQLIYTLFFLVVLLFYVIKEARFNYKRRVQNLIAISGGTLFILSLFFLDAGWTTYPPLKALGQEGLTYQQFTGILLAFQIFAAALILLIIFKWLRKKALLT
jgi:hypothetical protein